MSVEENLGKVLKAIGKRKITLVVVTKNHTWEEIEELYRLGCRDFGENRVQEAEKKITRAPKDIRWHFVGKLQKNKVAKVVGKFALIHSVDSLELAQKIGSESVKRGIVTNVLLEANTSGEETKEGAPPDEWNKCFSQVLDIKGLKCCGWMTMAPLTTDEDVLRKTFATLAGLRDELLGLCGEACELSMGMSNDYAVAIQEGATILRIGSAIFADE